MLCIAKTYRGEGRKEGWRRGPSPFRPMDLFLPPGTSARQRAASSGCSDSWRADAYHPRLPACETVAFLSGAAVHRSGSGIAREGPRCVSRDDSCYTSPAEPWMCLRQTRRSRRIPRHVFSMQALFPKSSVTGECYPSFRRCKYKKIYK